MSKEYVPSRQQEIGAKDVAEAAGVSRIMVSRAFNRDASVKSDKREHILKIAAELGYHPDMAARSMARGRSNLVAILVPNLSQPWEAMEVDALVRALQRNGMASLLFRMSPQRIGSEDLVQVRAYKPAAVIAYMDSLSPRELVPLFGNTPSIYPHYGTDVPAPQGGQRVDRLHIEQHAGIRSAVRLLAGSGRKRIVYVSGLGTEHTQEARNANSDHDRLVALNESIAEFGLELVAKLEGDFDYETARQNTCNFIRAGGKTDAFFAANDVSAFGVMDALRFDLGLRVPEDHAVVGFDNVPQAGWRAYDLTTVNLSVEARVAAIMRLVKSRLADPDGPTRVETVAASLIVRSSV